MTRIPPDPGYCAYGAERIRRRAAQLEAETDGVRKAEDIEAIHRMRVASRRIRAALPLFSCCIPKKKYDRWSREIRNVTRALGEARDKDVQIEFLNRYRERFSRGNGGVPAEDFLPLFHNPEIPLPEPPGPGATGPASCFPPRPEYGIDCLLLRYRGIRQDLQEPVVQALGRLARERTLEQMADYFRDTGTGAGNPGAGGNERPLTGYRAAARHIGALVAGLRKYSESLADAGRKEDHHQMRIVAKRLRYTMELYGDLYEGGLRDEIRELKELQDLLGEIHDCDVWIDSLPGFLKAEKKRARAYFGSGQFIRLIEPGIEGLLADRGEERDRLFRKLGTCWQDLEAGGFWDGLVAMTQRTLREASGS